MKLQELRVGALKQELTYTAINHLMLIGIKERAKNCQGKGKMAANERCDLCA